MASPPQTRTANAYGPYRLSPLYGSVWALLVVTGDNDVALRASSLPWTDDEIGCVLFEMLAEVSARGGWSSDDPIDLDRSFLKAA